MAVAEKNRAVGCSGEGSLGHGLHEGAVGLVCALEGEDLLPLRSVDNECVDLVVPDRPEGLFGLFETYS